MMNLFNGSGDDGSTCLGCGERVAKDDPRIEACGSADELSAFLGMPKCLTKERRVKMLIGIIQRDLISIGAEVARRTSHAGRLKRRIDAASIAMIERQISALGKRKVVMGNHFSLSGQNRLSSACHIARTVARRLERQLVTLKKKRLLKNDHIIIYVNRLSGLLFLLARAYETKEDAFR